MNNVIVFASVFFLINVGIFVGVVRWPIVQHWLTFVLVNGTQLRVWCQMIGTKIGMHPESYKVFKKLARQNMERHFNQYLQTTAQVGAFYKGYGIKKAKWITFLTALVLLSVLAAVVAFYCFGRRRNSRKLALTVGSRIRRILVAVGDMANRLNPRFNL
ncbi:hypothetical protein DM01DRAFT_1183597 [Hesseltinella vesiculosa]|uniref:Uncharacterized protein n=1 Tax=Hesseltinella vesiculosa TaxID=101127 RepID=A0A1X2G3Y4_9FUNG|nr:hypothetical protein DM01DRAFT_1183597 [Hesseltinella vesiculosa]